MGRGIALSKGPLRAMRASSVACGADRDAGRSPQTCSVQLQVNEPALAPAAAVRMWVGPACSSQTLSASGFSNAERIRMDRAHHGMFPRLLRSREPCFLVLIDCLLWFS